MELVKQQALGLLYLLFSLKETIPTFLYLLNLNPNALHALVYNLAPLWARPYTQPNIIQALSGPKLEIPSKVPPCSDPQVIEANGDQTERENKHLQKTFVPIQNRHKVDDKVWVMNIDKSKLQPKKVGPAIILKVNKNNTYLVQGLRKHKQDKVLHHDCLRSCKARQKLCETALPATEQLLVQYGTRAPDNLPDNLPPEEASLQLGGVKTAGLTLQQGFK
ncbi:hypothetical protein DSO57_1006673 [Entomophthora muscae]|uniref:Uncharacterized protein n=1 Tax=Entomophthora muscae TaxID=34485 RepID=A0ACC2TIJ9_9FUNG|nr:hypothetical protein DSO57_1006673 [Entomophthora muscae]